MTNFNQHVNRTIRGIYPSTDGSTLASMVMENGAILRFYNGNPPTVPHTYGEVELSPIDLSIKVPPVAEPPYPALS